MKTSRNFDKNALTLALVFSLTLFWLSACGDGESAPGVAGAVATNAAPSGETVGQGGAVIIISQGDETSLDGDAMYMMQSNADIELLLLSVYHYQNENDFTAISIANMKGEAKPGTYDINGDSDFKVAMIRKVAGVQSIGGPQSGQLVIFTSDSSRITGSFMFTMEMATDMDHENIIYFGVHGTFEAFKGEHTDLPAGLR